MFELYTERARRVIFFARYEASEAGAEYIEPRHLLLGLLREDKPLFARLLGDEMSALGLAHEIRSEIQKTSQPLSTPVDKPLSASAKRALIDAAEEQKRLSHKHIDCAHLLAGVLQEQIFAKSVLNRCGLTIGRVREYLEQTPASTPSSADPLPALRAKLAEAVKRLTVEIEPATAFALDRKSK